MTQLAFRHGVTIDLPTATPAFTDRRYYRLLNVPDSLTSSGRHEQSPRYGRGYVVVSAKNAVVAIRRTVTVELADMVDVQYIAPGRPAYYAIDEFGADFDYQLIQVTTYNHDESGRPIGLVTRDEAPQVTAQYRPNGDVPILPQYRTSVHQEILHTSFQLIGGQWRATIPLELGPPGVYAIEYASTRVVTTTSGQTGIAIFEALEWHTNSAFWDVSNSTNVGRPAVLPSTSTLYGPIGYEKDYYTDTGSFNLRFSATTQPLAGDSWQFQANLRLIGLGPMLQAEI
jgi:hypothetical protein